MPLPALVAVAARKLVIDRVRKEIVEELFERVLKGQIAPIVRRGFREQGVSSQAEVDVGPLLTDIRQARQALPKELGKVHKQVGTYVIRRLRPRPVPDAVGSGAGAAVRPSASKREVLLRVGGKHRADHSPYMQWGRRPARLPGEPAPPRPYITRTVRMNQNEILDYYWLAVKRAYGQAFEAVDG